MPQLHVTEMIFYRHHSLTAQSEPGSIGVRQLVSCHTWIGFYASTEYTWCFVIHAKLPRDLVHISELKSVTKYQYQKNATKGISFFV